jgi:hypothetical protein
MVVTVNDICPSENLQTLIQTPWGQSTNYGNNQLYGDSALNTAKYLTSCGTASKGGNPVIVTLRNDAKARRERVRLDYEKLQSDPDDSERHQSQVTKLGVLLSKLNMHVVALEKAVECKETKAAYDTVMNQICGKGSDWLVVLVTVCAINAFFLAFDIYYGVKAKEMWLFTSTLTGHDTWLRNTEIDGEYVRNSETATAHRNTVRKLKKRNNREDFPGV